MPDGPSRVPIDRPHRPASTAVHPASCLCCIGGPDLSFERAVFAVLALELGFDYDAAGRFIRLCRASPRMVLSKSKVKVAAKSRGKAAPVLSVEEVQRAQDAVLACYAETLALEEKQRLGNERE